MLLIPEPHYFTDVAGQSHLQPQTDKLMTWLLSISPAIVGNT
jgi:hypothetical protein